MNIYRYIPIYIILLALVGCGSNKPAPTPGPPAPPKPLTLEWDRNSESDVLNYHVYVCWTINCTVERSPEMLREIVPQTAPGVKPSVVLNVAGKSGKSGHTAVSARDLRLNESALSESVPLIVP